MAWENYKCDAHVMVVHLCAHEILSSCLNINSSRIPNSIIWLETDYSENPDKTGIYDEASVLSARNIFKCSDRSLGTIELIQFDAPLNMYSFCKLLFNCPVNKWIIKDITANKRV